VVVGEAVPLRVAVIGALRVESPGGEARVGGARRRGVLVRLLASPNRAAPTDLLVEDIWEGDSPAAAPSTPQRRLSALRQLHSPDRLSIGESGHWARLGPAELDALVDDDTAQARTHITEGSLRASPGAFEQAQRRWRGSPLADAVSRNLPIFWPV
jgi:DNA-binding SARP family transcriptional activator